MSPEVSGRDHPLDRRPALSWSSPCSSKAIELEPGRLAPCADFKGGSVSSRAARPFPLLEPGLEPEASSRMPNGRAVPLLEPIRRDIIWASGAVLELGLRQSNPATLLCRSEEGRNDAEPPSRGRGGGWNMKGDALLPGLVRSSELSVCNLGCPSPSRRP